MRCMVNKEMFIKVLDRFNELKDELDKGNITAEEMRNELKELMIKNICRNIHREK